MKVCDINDDVKDGLKNFRFRKNKSNSALICKFDFFLLLLIIFIDCQNKIKNFFLQVKVDREKQKICIDNILDDISIDELRESLPSHQPRYVIYSYKMQHHDGRVSYPMCFIYFTPRGIFN